MSMCLNLLPSKTWCALVVWQVQLLKDILNLCIA